jgi:hypothetical protein
MCCSPVLQATLLLMVAANSGAAGAAAAAPTVQLTRHAEPVERTYLFSNANWWESADHQMTTAITLLALAHEVGAVAVAPEMAPGQGGPRGQYSLLADFYDMDALRRAQSVVGLSEFMKGEDYGRLRAVAGSAAGVSFPKLSQERYEEALKVLSRIDEGTVGFGMPHVDPENTDMYCSQIAGTVHTSADGRVRFVFLDRIHFFHFCTEAYMPWWYDVRMHIAPRREYRELAARFARSLPSPLTVVHVRDIMDAQKERGEGEVQHYARQIADAMRRRGRQSGGSLYLAYAMDGRSVVRVARLFEDEFPVVRKCLDLYVCGRVISSAAFDPQLPPELQQTLFGTHVGADMTELALATQADHFVGNIYSPSSRNIALHRKLHGKTYDMLKGFGELKKVYRWHL